MNYDHAYHAGNFADVLKHITLICLFDLFLKKEKAFCYLDTHAGAPFYDLSTNKSQIKKEYTGGITKILNADSPPSLIKRYLTIVNNSQKIDVKEGYFYPGSSFIAKASLREQDHMILCELKKEPFSQLKSFFKLDKKVSVHFMDGWLALKAFLPPKEKRGLILIDPPYEEENEFDRIIEHLLLALQRFSHGVYTIWYPIKADKRFLNFKKKLSEELSQSAVSIELTIQENIGQQLNGSGMIIINPPYQFEEHMKTVMPWIFNSLRINDQGTIRLQSLK